MPILRPVPLAMLAAAVLAGAAAPAALAADAPSRRIDINANGRIAETVDITGVSAGGRDLVFNQFSEPDPRPVGGVGADHRVVARDLVAGKTTVLSDPYDRSIAASTDLQRVLFRTKRSLTSADRNNSDDLYLHDRRTKVNLLVTRSANGQALPAPQSWGSAALSGDGQTVFFGTGGGFDTPTAPKRIWRFSAATSALTLEVDGAELSEDATDSAGRVLLTDRGIYRDRVLVPGTSRIGVRYHLSAVISADGLTVAAQAHEDDGAEWHVVKTATGQVTKVPTGSFVGPDNFFRMLRISDDGRYGIAPGDGGVSPTTGYLTQLWKVDLTTGNAIKLGGTFPESDALLVDPTWAFAVTAKSIVQLGSTPFPGTDVTPVRPPAAAYLSYWEGCRGHAGLGTVTQRPSLGLGYPRDNPFSYPFPEPVSATVTVKINATGVVLNMFTLGFLQSKPLMAVWGGTTYSGTVTFKDGVRGQFSQAVAAYTPRYCPKQPV